MNEELQPGLGQRLRVARQHQGLTQAQVAQAVGLVPAVYGRLERGSGLPSVNKLQELCAVLNVSATALLGLGPLEVPPPQALPEESPELRRLMANLHGLPPEKLRVLEHLAKVFDTAPKKGDPPSPVTS